MRLAGTLALATAAGALAQALHSPLPWMIGPLLACAMAGVLGWPVRGALALRNVGQWVIGSVLGLYFTPQMLGVVARLAPEVLAGVLWALALGYGFYRWLMYSHARLHSPGAAARSPGQAVRPATAYFASAIGGASEMALLAERHGAQIDRVAAAHSLRVLIVVVLIPFGLQASGVHGADLASPASLQVHAGGLVALLAATALGGLLLQWRRLPNPWVLGALLVSGLLSASGVHWSAVPKPMANAAQLLIAVSLGVRFSPSFVRAAPRWLGAVALGTLVMVALSAAIALPLAWVSGLHPATALLASSPGGMAEMAITATVLGLGVPVVTAFHVVRYVAVLLLTEPIWRWEQRRLGG